MAQLFSLGHITRYDICVYHSSRSRGCCTHRDWLPIFIVIAIVEPVGILPFLARVVAAALIFITEGSYLFHPERWSWSGEHSKESPSVGDYFLCLADWLGDSSSVVCSSSLPQEIWRFEPCGLTSRRSQPPLALAVPLSRFTSRVGGGSAFFVRRLAL